MFIYNNCKNFCAEFREDFIALLARTEREIVKIFNGRNVKDLTQEVSRFSGLSNQELEDKYKQATKHLHIAMSIAAILATITVTCLALSLGPQGGVTGTIAFAAGMIGLLSLYPVFIYQSKKMDIENEAERRGFKFVDSRLARVEFIQP